MSYIFNIQLKRDAIVYPENGGRADRSGCETKEQQGAGVDCENLCQYNKDGNANYESRGKCFPGWGHFSCYSFDQDKSCDIGLSSQGKNPVLDKKQKGCVMTCTYDLDNIDTEEQWKNINNKADLTDEQKDIILQKYCRLTSSDCPKYDGVVAKSCSRLVSKDFPECNIYNNTYNESTDSMKQDYSNNNPKNPDSACILREDDKDYNLVKGQLPVDDGCWYIPCQSPGTILQTNDKKIRDPSCPENICQQVYNLPESTQVEISKNKNILQCANQKNSKTIIIVFSIIGGIIVLALFSFPLYRYAKKNTKKAQSPKKAQVIKK